MAFHEDLRNHRLKKGLILEEISEDTKINVRILQAIEQGDYHILPVPYIRLFMKAYAHAIDYPVEDILRGLENELKLTGEQGVNTELLPDSTLSMDMTGATVSNAQNMLQADKGPQNNLTRLIIGIIILIVVIILGKSLLKPNIVDPNSPQHHILPAMNLKQSLDSLEIADSLLSANSYDLTITATDFLSIIHQVGGKVVDTTFQEPGKLLSLTLTDSTELKLYPSDAALFSIKQDTLPDSPFSNSWLVVTVDSLGGHLRTYPTL